MRRLTTAYLVISLILLATSLYTGHRAGLRTGEPYHLFTSTHIFVSQNIAPENETEAELDAAFAEAGDDSRISVKEPMFVLGLVDATGPFIVGGALLITIRAAVMRLRRPTASPAGNPGKRQL